MKTFDNPVLKTEVINECSEKMTLVLDNDFKLWFHHEDCNKDFEPLTKLTVYSYTLNKEEESAVLLFMSLSIQFSERKVRNQRKNLHMS
jgi:hypothetical protein